MHKGTTVNQRAYSLVTKDCFAKAAGDGCYGEAVIAEWCRDRILQGFQPIGAVARESEEINLILYGAIPNDKRKPFRSSIVNSRSP